MLKILVQHQENYHQLILEKPSWQFHDYGKKEVKTGRKMGHITILTENIEDTLKVIQQTNIWD